jgi:GrpB-like predicted nucleotidyltransferase (UPF0157 family)
MERYGGGRIVICEYDPSWPRLFDEEQMRVRDALGSLATRIEHVGSTAVPGLAAKPVIDLLVGVRSLVEARSGSIDPLGVLGYTYMKEYESWLPDEMLFRKGSPGPWTHHLHLTEPSSPRWEEFILIRDYLRTHADVARAYGDLKTALATLFQDDIAGFRDAKGPFLRAVLAKARADASTERPGGPST